MIKSTHLKRAFGLVAKNEDVKLSHLLIKGKGEKPMLMLHGLLGSMRNWRSLCKHKELIMDRRACYLVE